MAKKKTDKVIEIMTVEEAEKKYIMDMAKVADDDYYSLFTRFHVILRLDEVSAKKIAEGVIFEDAKVVFKYTETGIVVFMNYIEELYTVFNPNVAEYGIIFLDKNVMFNNKNVN